MTNDNARDSGRIDRRAMLMGGSSIMAVNAISAAQAQSPHSAPATSSPQPGTAPTAKMADDLWRLDASESARLIRLGRVSSREATESCLARLDAVNPKINAVVRVLAREALAAADAADKARAQGDILGPLHGVSVTTKINTDQAGSPTDNGVAAFRDLIASEDSPVVANLKRAGAVIIGRTNAPAFSLRMFSDNALHGRTLNPRDPALSAGGSSGGAGAAVAVGIGAIAQGNDIGGSVRIPAFYDGVVGLRVLARPHPSYNPSHPIARPIGAQLMAVEGPLARSVRDARLALAAMARGDPIDTRWVDASLAGPPVPRPIHVALVAHNPGGFTHPAQAEAVREAGQHLAAAGYAVEEVAPPDLDEIIARLRIGSTDVMRVAAPLIEKLGDADAHLDTAVARTGSADRSGRRADRAGAARPVSVALARLHAPLSPGGHADHGRSGAAA